MNRLGLIGLGGIASRHIKELEQVKNARIGAICDADETKLEKRGEQLGIGGASASRTTAISSPATGSTR